MFICRILTQKYWQLICCFFLIVSQVQAQSNYWYFGNKAGVRFLPDSSLSVLNNGQLISNEGAFAMSDENGNLLMYSNGITLWDKQHLVMQNGSGLWGDRSSVQSGIIVPRPNNPGRYFVFTVDMQAGLGIDDFDGQARGLRYNEVNMLANNGNGQIIPGRKNLPLKDTILESITAVKHSNGVDYWVIVHSWNSAEYCSFLVDENGVNTNPIISISGPIITGGLNGSASIGTLKASPRGDLLAASHAYVNNSVVVSRFDAATGRVSFVQELPFSSGAGTIGPYSLAFSACQNYLYVSELFTNQGPTLTSPLKSIVHRVQLSESGQTISQEQMVELPFEYASGLQLAMDGNIYTTSVGRIFDAVRNEFATSFRPFLHRISNPNEKNALFEKDFVALGSGLSAFALPNFLVNPYTIENPTIEISKLKYCIDDTATIIGHLADYDSLKWFFNGILINNSDTVFNYIFTESGSFDLELQKFKCGLLRKESLNLEIIPLPKFNIPDTSFCENAFVNLVSPLLADEYLWSNGDTMVSLEIGIPGTYSLSITQSTCSFTDTFWVNEIPIPEIEITGNPFFCPDSGVILTALVQPDSAFIKWSNDSSTTQIFVTQPGVIVVMASLNACFASDSFSVQTAPDLQVSFPSDTTLCDGEIFEIIPNSLGATKIIWQDSSESNAFSVTKSGIYTATVCGFCDTLQYSVQIDFIDCECQLHVPNAFSPNNDGVNDVFRVLGTCVPSEFFLQIFNRWGQKVFETRNFQQSWNGYFNGVLQPLDSYIFYIEYENPVTKERKSLQGAVSLLK